MIEEEIERVRISLNQVRVKRQQQKEEIKYCIDEASSLLDIARRTYSDRLQKSKDLSHYFSIMKAAHSCHSLPNSRTLRMQSILLFCVHQIDVLQKAIEMMEHQTNSLVQYMQCEIVVLEEEIEEVGRRYQDQKKIQCQNWDIVERPLLRQIRIQDNAIGHIRSLLVLKRRLRYPSSISSLSLKSVSNCSERAPDLKENRLPGSTLQRLNWIQSLPTHDSNSEPISMMQLLKELLEIDGTFFPIQTEVDKYLEHDIKGNLYNNIVTGVSHR
jgi:hypothetical protein